MPTSGRDRIRAGVVLYRDCLPQTALSLIGLERALGDHLTWQFEIGADVSPSRNRIAASALAAGNAYVLYLDGDMVFTPTDFQRLLEGLSGDPEIGALSGNYLRWDGSGLPVANWRNGNGWVSEAERRNRAAKATGVEAVDSFGGGFLLVSREALAAVPPPWFQGSYDQVEYIGNDTHFCRALQRAGFRPSVDFGVGLGHIGPKEWRAPDGE